MDGQIAQLLVSQQAEQQAESADDQADHQDGLAGHTRDNHVLIEVGKHKTGFPTGGGRVLGESVHRRDEQNEEGRNEGRKQTESA